MKGRSQAVQGQPCLRSGGRGGVHAGCVPQAAPAEATSMLSNLNSTKAACSNVACAVHKLVHK